MSDAQPKPSEAHPPAGLHARRLSTRLLILWAAGLALALVLGVGLGPQQPEHPTPISLPNAYRLLVGVELFLLLAVAPLVSGDGTRRPRVGLLQLFLLLAIAAPVVVATAWAADVGLASVAASQAYLLVAAAFVAGYLRRDPAGAWRSCYICILGALGGGAPMAAFVIGDLFRLPLTWLYALSPFWVADRLCHPWQFDGHWAVPSVVLLVAAALFVWPRRRIE